MNEIEPIPSQLKLTSEADVLKLFQNYNIQQIKSYDRDLEKQMAQLTSQFTGRLKAKYKDILQAVSYTHLDVYKRQAYNHPNFVF